MQTRIPLVTILALSLLLAAVVFGQDPFAAPAEPKADEDPRVQQYVQMLQPAFWKELDFIRQVCDLKPAQRPKIKAAAEASVKQAAKAMAVPRRQGDTPTSATRSIRDGVAAVLKETLDPEQFARYSEEAEKRAADYKQATILSVVSQLDGVLYLQPEQRKKIMAALDANWRSDWEQWLMMHQYAGQYFPQVPDPYVVNDLTPDQKTVWRGLQKVNINAWGGENAPRPADDAWWEGKPDNAGKAKGKAKAKAAKAAP